MDQIQSQSKRWTELDPSQSSPARVDLSQAWILGVYASPSGRAGEEDSQA